MTESEGWEFYKRLVVSQLEENKVATEELHDKIRILEDYKNIQSAQIRILIIVWSVIGTCMGWLISHLWSK